MGTRVSPGESLKGRLPPLARITVVRRLSWGVADQAISSLGNFALGLVLVRSLGAEGFGAFTLAFVTYGVVLNASRGLSTDPLVVRFSGDPDARWRTAVAASSATALMIGTLAGVACLVSGLFLPGSVSAGFVALGLTLPGMMLQDSWRFAFFSSGRARKAFVNDLLWAVLQLGSVFALYLTGYASVFTCLLAFGVTGGVAAAFGFWQLRIRPTLRGVRGWLYTHRDLGSRYVVENVSISLARQLRMFALGALAGLASVAQVRAAEMLMGPFLVILMGVSQVAVPEASHVLQRQPARLVRFCFLLGAVQAAAAVLWAGAIAVLFSFGLGEYLLQSLWAPALALLPAVMVNFAAGAFETGAAAGLRALGAASRSLRSQLTSAAAYVVLGASGAAVDGARGSCWGVAIAATGGLIVWWVQLRRGLADHLAGVVRSSSKGVSA